MFIKTLSFLLGFLSAGAAFAQGPDPRLIAPALQALQGNLAFAEAKIKVLEEDHAAVVKRLCAVIMEDKRPPECKNDNKP